MKWKEIYNSEEEMKIMYNGWERWITTTGMKIKVGDGTTRTFHAVMAMWYNETPSISEDYKAPPLFEVQGVGDSGDKHAADSFTESPSRNTRKWSRMVADSGMTTRKKGNVQKYKWQCLI